MCIHMHAFSLAMVCVREFIIIINSYDHELMNCYEFMMNSWLINDLVVIVQLQL